ncbi:hypothetical protein HS088_TW14G00502 [Tripterygium wilfordii]|uniref:Uncharacterized protein n=1 Tax=Tripterygium wilfordii TaxID=458696 RepID=A0A7J7CQJ8_TRIWF|nr:hypothetical protein HS088_TW14G00502 [Tripterygium wilfordii]
MANAPSSRYSSSTPYFAIWQNQSVRFSFSTLAYQAIENGYLNLKAQARSQVVLLAQVRATVNADAKFRASIENCAVGTLSTWDACAAA